MLLYTLLGVYLMIGALCIRYERRISRAYYTNHKGNLLLETFVYLLWPFGLPSFLYHYRDVIKSVKEGRDWADDNIPVEEWRVKFREWEQENAKAS